MSNKLTPYLTFIGKTREAMEFYKSALGGELTLQTFKDLNMAKSPDQENLIMHSQLTTSDGMVLMASDDPESSSETKNASLTISGEDEAVLTGYFNKLSEGGNVIVPMSKQVWGDVFGMFADKYGIRWMVNVNQPKS